MEMKNTDRKKTPLINPDGFTLVEIIAVLVILGIIGSFAVGKVIALDTTAVQKSFTWSVSELNSREHLVWSQVKMSPTNWVDDLSLFALVNHDLGPGYEWSGRNSGGGTLVFKGQQIEFERRPSTATHPASSNTNPYRSGA